jgi:hypothetical protein
MVVLAPNTFSAVGWFTLSAANGAVNYSINTESAAVTVSAPSGMVTPGHPATITVTYSPELGPLPSSITVNNIVVSLSVG